MRWIDQVADRCVGKNRNEIAAILERAMYAVTERCAELHQSYEDAALEPLR